MFDLVEATQVVTALRTFAAAFDPALVRATDAAELVSTMAEVERLAGGVRVAAAGRVADTSAWKRQGHRTAEEWLAATSRTSIGEASGDLGTAKRLEQLPRTAEALRSGRLTPRQAKEITGAAYFAPEAEATLLEVADRESLRGLQDRCKAVRQASMDDAARNAKIRRERYLRTSTDVEGAFCLSMRGPAADGVRLMAALQPFQAGAFEAARIAGDRPPYEATAFDAMLAMATAAHGNDTRRPGDAASPPVAASLGDSGASRPSAAGGGRVDPLPLAACARGTAAGDGRPGDPTPHLLLEPPGPPNRAGDRASPPSTSSITADDTHAGSAAPGQAGRPGPHSSRRPDSRSGDVGRARRVGPVPASSPSRARSTDADPPPDGSGRTARPPTKGGRDVKVIVRLDHAALLRGHAEAGEICEVAGLGPIPVSAVHELMADAFIAAVVTRGVDVTTVAHLGRRPTAYQETALEWQAPVCSVAGCPRTVAIEHDHRTPWVETQTTATDNLDPLCHFHHELKTHRGYRLEPGTGRRRLLPPPTPSTDD